MRLTDCGVLGDRLPLEEREQALTIPPPPIPANLISKRRQRLERVGQNVGPVLGREDQILEGAELSLQAWQMLHRQVFTASLTL